MLFDDVFRQVGEFGRYQALVYCLLGLVGIPTGWQNMAITFIGADVGSWCDVDALQNVTSDEQRVYISMVFDDVTQQYSRCEMYDQDYARYSAEELAAWNRSVNIPPGCPKKRCSKLTFNQTIFSSTIGSQWELVCERQPLISLVQTIYMAGFLTGCLIFGQISDSIGRKKAMLIGLVLQAVFAFGATFCPLYELYCALRFVVGAAAAGAFTSIFVLTMELTGARYRMAAGIFMQTWFAVGLITFPGMSFLIRDHIQLQALAAGLTVLLWGLYFIIPESPRWLVTHGKDAEAVKVMQLLARRNGKRCPSVEAMNLTENRQMEKADAKASIIDLWRGRKIRRITILMWFCWFVTSLSYYGLSLGVDFLKGSLFFNSCLSGLVEIPAYVIIIMVMDRTGRRWPTIVTFALGAVFCLACMPLFSQPNLNGLLTVFLMLGKCSVAGTFAILYVYAAELFPTVVRNVGVGSSSMCARISGLLQPQVSLMRWTWVPLPFLIYGTTSLIAAISAFLLPETLGKQLPETLEDIERDNKTSVIQTSKGTPKVYSRTDGDADTDSGSTGAD